MIRRPWRARFCCCWEPVYWHVDSCKKSSTRRSNGGAAIRITRSRPNSNGHPVGDNGPHGAEGKSASASVTLPRHRESIPKKRLEVALIESVIDCDRICPKPG